MRGDLAIVRVDQDYILKTKDDDKTLYELLGYDTQLIVDHFMFKKIGKKAVLAVLILRII